jgi:hypothetical protein
MGQRPVMNQPPNKRLLSPLWGWDVLSAASQLQVRPKVGRYV